MEDRHPRIVPSRSSLPMRQSTGSPARWSPSGVRVSSAVMAPMFVSALTAASIAWECGGSTILPRNSLQSPSWSFLMCRQTSSRGTRIISGTGCFFILPALSLVKREKHTPGCTRPARPFLCFALAAEIQPSMSMPRPLEASYCLSLTCPESTTKTMSSIVMEVSAMFVARTNFLIPLGGFLKTPLCSSGEMFEWRGMIQSLFAASLPKW
mmetsp:Transcript_2589/g.7891  ORF Transcript_2589/g.7891 Transcript_2589/m.7891 type:complete len:210 (-) Transcript_2589:664-1293(-)